MKKIVRTCFFILLAMALYAGLSVSAADADVPEEFTAEETQLLTEAVAPLTEALSEYYFINSIQFQPISHDPVFPSENRIYANVTYNTVLLAEELSDLPYFEGICRYVGVDSIADLTQADIEAVLSSGNAPICAETSALAQEDVSVQAVYSALKALQSQFEENIGRSSDGVYTVCVTLDEAGEIADVCAMTETRFVPLSDFFPEPAEKMQADGVTSLNNCITELVQAPDVEISAAPPLYYRVAARDYANTYTSEAAYSSTCPHGSHYIDLTKYNKSFSYYCHNDCANFVSQAMWAGQIPTDSEWSPDTAEWKHVPTMRTYFLNKGNYWKASDYTNCNAGGIIINCDTDGPYHVNMCVQNDTVTRKYSAHNKDHCQKSYSAGYWGSDTVEYYVFLSSTTADAPGDTQ